MVGTIAAAVCAAFLLYGGWLVLLELISGRPSAREPEKPPFPKAAPLADPE